MKENKNLKTYALKDMTNYKVHGRTNEDMFPLPLFWNNSGVEVNCTGTELWIDLDVECDFYEPWIATELNGAFMSRQMLLAGEYSICLFRSMAPGVAKNVKFYRELQAIGDDNLCHVLVKGFRTDGEFLPVKESRFKFEFLGDSITSGEGTYGATQDTEWLSMYMSSSRHYANIIAHELDADIRIVSQGGWGVYCGWDNNVNNNIPSIYEEICGTAKDEDKARLGAHNKYDFSKWVADAVIVNLGTNDATAFNQPALEVPGVGLCQQRRNPDGSYVEEDIEKVKNAVTNFLKVIRKNNPTAHIVWVYGMLGYDLTLPIADGVNRYMKETGDSNVAFINLPDTTDDTYGAHMHPGYESHKAAAAVLGLYLKRKFTV